MKGFFKKISPPIIVDLAKSFKPRKYGWFGDYETWEEASKESVGYDDSAILEKVLLSALKVKNKEVVYERDGVLFDEIQYFWPMLSSLLFCAARNKGVLNLVDFGGSLGTTYYQNRKFLDRLDGVNWHVVEQSHYVKAGREHIQDDRIKFFDTVESATSELPSSVLLLSSVLQYIEDLDGLMNYLLQFDFKYIIVDLTPFTFNGQSRITIQKVDPSIYTANYPCRLLSYKEILAKFSNKYALIEEFSSMEHVRISIDGEDVANYRGFILEKK